VTVRFVGRESTPTERDCSVPVFGFSLVDDKRLFFVVEELLCHSHTRFVRTKLTVVVTRHSHSEPRHSSIKGGSTSETGPERVGTVFRC
jgi:hypothetical protein